LVIEIVILSFFYFYSVYSKFNLYHSNQKNDYLTYNYSKVSFIKNYNIKANILFLDSKNKLFESTF